MFIFEKTSGGGEGGGISDPDPEFFLVLNGHISQQLFGLFPNKSICWSLRIEIKRNRGKIVSFNLFTILQGFLWYSKCNFISNILSDNCQAKTSSLSCFSFMCRFREPLCLNAFSHRSHLKVEKKGECAFSKCCFRFRSNVKDFPQCPQVFVPDFCAECTSSLWRLMFSSLLNCLSHWVQEYCFWTGPWIGLNWGNLCTSFMCLLRWSLEIDFPHLSHLTFEVGSGLPSSLLRCFKYSLKSVNFPRHLWQVIASLWTFSLWYLSDVSFEKVFKQQAPSRVLHSIPFCFWCMYFSWWVLEPFVENNLLQNRHVRSARCLTSSSFGESSFSSLSLFSSSLPSNSSSEPLSWFSSSPSMLELCEFSLPISTTAFLTGVSTLMLMLRVIVLGGGSIKIWFYLLPRPSTEVMSKRKLYLSWGHPLRYRDSYFLLY